MDFCAVYHRGAWRRFLLLCAALWLCDAQAGSTNYRYDELGRLLSASYGNGVYTLYGYDATGNRTQVTSGTDTIAPTVPTGVTASALSSTQVQVSWTASTDTGGSGLIGYQIFRAGSPVGTSTTPLYVDATTSGTTTYSYSIQALDAAGNLSAVSGSASVTTPDTIAPSVPTALGLVSASSTAVAISWNASTDTGGSGLAGYRIYRKGILIGSSASTGYTDSSVTGWNSYRYTVAAYDNAGNVSVQSGDLAVAVPDTIPPTVPTGLTATTPNANEVDLSWASSTDVGSGVAGYNVYRGGILLGTTSFNPHFVDQAIGGGATVTYNVAAVDFAGNASAQGSGLSVTTPAGVPPAPLISISPSGIAYGGNFTVLWTGYPGATTYQLYQAVGTGSYSLDYSGTALSKDFSSKPTNDYTYYVLACNGSGCSVASDTPTVTSCPTSGCP